MMTNRVFSTVKSINFSLIHSFSNINKYAAAACAIQNVRTLYTKTTLGVDNFLKQSEVVKHQMENISEKFKEKMHDYAQGDKNIIFTEDLKNMIHLSSNDKDIELVVDMIKKFNQQNKQMRFGNYVFGPVVMRLFHHFNKPHIALECFKSPDLTGFFDQLMSYQLLLDLLYENQMYNEMLDVFDDVTSRQIEGMKYPRNIVVLGLAACYKLNSKESLERALKIWNDLKNVGHYPMRRATTFCAGLAYNQGEPGIAIEILTSAKNQNYSTVRNLKVASLSAIGRVEHVIPILKSILSQDSPTNTRHTFSKDVIETAKQAAAKSDNADIKLEIEQTEQLLIKGGHIDEMSVDEQLCSEIQSPPILNNRNRTMPDRPRRQWQGDNRMNRFNSQRHRPGLDELV